MTKKPEWQIERDKQRKLRRKGLQELTLEQLQAIHATYEALNSTILSIRDLNDIMLSDIKALDEACCDLHQQFNLGDD
jgi:hypothetical protein|tara:strand:- start:54 stop:287 length:234 start_codon:yes stop_codon:yes gene_type:complete